MQEINDAAAELNTSCGGDGLMKALQGIVEAVATFRSRRGRLLECGARCWTMDEAEGVDRPGSEQTHISSRHRHRCAGERSGPGGKNGEGGGRRERVKDGTEEQWRPFGAGVRGEYGCTSRSAKAKVLAKKWFSS
jgi:hypothetical protein